MSYASTRTAATPARWCRPASSSAAATASRSGTAPLALNTWTHLATTYDGTTLRLFVNGAQVGQLAFSGSITTSTGALRIGGNAIWGECFQGDIDEVRIYNRALTATEIQADMNTSISAPDTTPPSAPGTLDGHRRPRPGRTRLGRGDGQRRRRPLQRPPRHERRLHALARRTGSRSRPGRATPTPASPPAPTTTSVTAEDVAGNVGPAGNEASAAAAADTTPPTVAITAPASGATVSGTVSRRRRTRPTTAPSPASSSSSTAPTSAPRTPSSPYSVSWDTFAAGERLAHAHRGRARRRRQHDDVGDRARDRLEHGLAGLVGAWAFDEGSGTTTADQSGQRQQRHAHERRLGDDGQVQQRALLQRHECLGRRRRLGHARPDDRDDARGVGAAGRRRTAGARRSRRTARQPRLRPLREHERQPPAAARSSSAARADARTAPPRCRSAAGATSPSPTTARRCASSSTARRSSQLRRRGLDRDVDLGAAHRRQRRLGRVVQRHDRRGAGLQPRLDAQRDPERHGPQHHARHDAADDPRADADARRGRDQRRHARPRARSTS